MPDNTLPAEIRLSLYLSTRLLQELQLALQLLGIPARYDRPGITGIGIPRLVVNPAEEDEETFEVDETDDVICALPMVHKTLRLSWTDLDPQWWFMWWGDEPLPICQAVDMNKAARIIADQLFEESA
jgi:hypothetical protein